MTTKKTQKLKKRLIIITCAVILTGAITAGFIARGNKQIREIPALSFADALAYTTRDNKDAVITVGVVKDGKATFTVYGENGKVLPEELHRYEIGSITKTITATLVSKAIDEGRINLADTIDLYLPLPEGKSYPTVAQLLTHTSGYKEYYLELPMVSSLFTARNGFYGISKEMLLKRIASVELDGREHNFHYSNFGFAVLGLILEAAYKEDYTALTNQYLQDELRLPNTQISDGSGDLGHYWDWEQGDAYIPAGAIVSDISDMLSYAQLQLDGAGYLKQCHKSIKEISVSSAKYAMLGIRTDEVGMAWIIDKAQGIIWHNGATSDYNSYLGFDPGSQTAVVILSNLAPTYRIPATVLGVKLLQSLTASFEA